MKDGTSRSIREVVSATSGKEKFFFFIKIAIAAGLLFYLYSKIDSVKMADLFANADYRYVGGALFLMIPNLAVQYYKWKLLCEKTLGEGNRSKILRSLFYGFAGGSFTPAQIGMFFGRRLAFPNRSMLEIVTASALDKLFTLFVILFSGSAALMLFLNFYTDVSTLITIAVTTVTLVSLFLLGSLILSESFWNGFVYNTLGNVPYIKKHLEKLAPLKSLDKQTAALLLFFSFLFYLCFILQYALLVMAFTPEHAFVHFLWAGMLVSFIKAVVPSISIGELGIREGASIYFLASFGLAEEVGFNAAFSLFLINVLLPSLIGFFLLLRHNKNL